MITGFDVSHNNGKIDWLKLKSMGFTFCFIKATQGITFVDPMFEENWTLAGESGFLRGAYHFFTPNQDPYSQANLFMKTLSTCKTPAELPAVLDFESRGQAVPAQTQIDYALNWLVSIEKMTKKIPIIYTGYYFMSELGNPPMFSSYPLWVADYEVEVPKIPMPWHDWSFWQYTNKTPDGWALDLNYFQGDAYALRDLGLTISS